MPEGDTIFKLAAYLDPALRGRRVVAGYAQAAPRIDLSGHCVQSVHAQGKHLFIRFDRHRLLRSHLGMWGSWHGYSPGEPWLRPRDRASIVLDVGERVYVCFNAKDVEWLREQGVSYRRLGVTLGPDLLDTAADYLVILARARDLSDPKRAIADVLLDQKIACGVGNVYKSETLFLEHRHPQTALADLADEELLSLYRRAAGLLAQNTRGGPRITRRSHDEAGILWVYGRAGQPCLRCDARIEGRLLGERQRSTFWCPRCQPDRPANGRGTQKVMTSRRITRNGR